MNILIITFLSLMFFTCGAYAEKTDLNGAIKACTEAVENRSEDSNCIEYLMVRDDLSNENLAKLHYLNGYRYFWSIKDFDRAIIEYTKSIELNGKASTTFSAHVNRGYSYLFKSEFSPALDDYVAADKIWSNHPASSKLYNDIKAAVEKYEAN